ncbi:hypothetical protein mru_0686 [Methanobrevibacter ruminantium M1]|uniref:DUF3100 domain-containing protein n=1 Tax=Methanobrevibacter ruminantium (strain ATCC 35063 / DSM 1093 / JCM 13430 / OCM 146 / M1) TaxID=634498 RepID=D3E1X6_METRM|nr:DUF3100 domain-containing protein [Methanobrevibacter ruminantium]ADC46537.1 hypothetical protein mru_0686 [Methanobrevibacter ruminantium M1]
MAIGVKEIKITDTISILLLPLIYALVLGLALYLAKPIKFIGRKQSKVAEGAMVLFIGVLITKLAISSGQAIASIFQVGPALLLQQIGNLGTLIALPIALFFGFRREVIGMTSSICREPNLGVIIDKYGFKSPETRGVLAVFVIGSILGTPFISFLSSISASLIPMHPYAYAMASGVGSASMNAAALAPLMHMFPSMATDLEAFAGCSNLLSFCFGIYMCIFVSLPLAERMYKWLSPHIGHDKEETIDDEYAIEGVKHDKYASKEELSSGKIKRWATFLLIFSFTVAVGNYIGYHTSLLDSFIGMIIISLITILGMSLERIIPWNIQSIIYISLIGIIVAIPGMPTADFIVRYVSQIDLTTICTAFLAYVGIAIGNDWEEFKKIGWRGIIITLIVISGTYLCSAGIAHLTLVATGMV